MKSGLDLIQNKHNVGSQLHTDFLLFVGRKQYYASYILESLPGNRMQKGSSSAESNHSSALVYLNNRNRGPNTYQEHPMLLVRDLLRRQGTHVANHNQILFKLSQQMLIEQKKLDMEPDGIPIINDLPIVVKELNHAAYERYKKNCQGLMITY